MSRQSFVITIAFLSAVAPILGNAQGTTNDEDNYLGDKLSFPVNVNLDITNPDGSTSRTLCVPAGTTLRGLGKRTDDKGLKVRVANVFGEAVDCSDNTTPLPKNIALTVPPTVLNEFTPDRYGLTYGVLVVPYKYHFSGSKDFKGNSTVGPFLGYRFDRNTVGVGIKAVGFVGGSAIEVTRTNNNQTKTETLAGFSYGVGLLGEIKNEFQLGVVFGADRVSKGSDYEDNGKLWGAVALGFSFAN
jgi:hypothetical protein